MQCGITFSPILCIPDLVNKESLPVQDDDSDMECELEASPAVTLEASVEAEKGIKDYSLVHFTP